MNFGTTLTVIVLLCCMSLLLPITGNLRGEEKKSPTETVKQVSAADFDTLGQTSANTVGWPQYVTWIIAGLALLTGGLGGAALTAVISVFRNRVQPISYRIETIFSPTMIPTSSTPIRAEIMVVRNGQPAPYQCDLAVVQVEFVNRSNKDFAECTVGISLAQQDSAIHVEAEKPDRLHVVDYQDRPDPENRLRHIVCTMRPFNRGETYSIKVFLDMVSDDKKVGDIQLSTSEVGVRLVPSPTFSEIAKLYADPRLPISVRAVLFAANLIRP